MLTSILFPAILTQVGYQPVGINPLLLPDPGVLTSNTARQLLSALAMKRVFSSLLRATLLGVEPVGESGIECRVEFFNNFHLPGINNRNSIVIGIGNKKIAPSPVMHMSLGLSPTVIDPVIFRTLVSKRITLSQPQQEI